MYIYPRSVLIVSVSNNAINYVFILNFSIEQLRAVVQESHHQREQELYAQSMNSKEKEDLLENERSMIASKLAELSDEQSKKMLQKEIRLREDAQSKFTLLEKVSSVRVLHCLKHFTFDSSDQERISPHNINTISGRQLIKVMGVKENINYRIMT